MSIEISDAQRSEDRAIRNMLEYSMRMEQQRLLSKVRLQEESLRDQFAGMTYDEWTNGAIAGRIARNALGLEDVNE